MNNSLTRARFIQAAPSDDEVAPATSESGPRVFISHSKVDVAHAELFLTHLVTLRDKHRLDIFYEVRKLVAGDPWHGRIMSAARRCDVFVLLVSPHSIASAYCIGKELHAALTRTDAPPAVIVPILLHPCSWEILQLPDASGRTLKDIQSLPQGCRFVMADRGTRANELWTEVVKGLERTLEELVLPRMRPRRHGDDGVSRHPPIPDLLPYLCDQSDVETDIENALDAWKDRSGGSLVMLLRARPDDCPAKFVERVLARKIEPLYSKLGARYACTTHTGLKWPGLDASDWSPEMLQTFFLKQLKERLVGDRTASDDALVKALRKTRCHQLILSELPTRPVSQLDGVLKAFAHMLETLGSRCAPLRLAALFWSQDEATRTDPLFGGRAADGQIAIPRPMARFTRVEAREWARLDEVRRVATLDDSHIDAALGEFTSDISMMQFAHRAWDLLSSRRS